MKNMGSTPDYYIPPAEGPHPGRVIAAEAGLSKRGNTQIHVSVQLDGMSEVVEDYIGTDGTVKGASLGKAKLRGLGVDVTTDAEVPDEVIASQILGRSTIVEIEHENAQRKDESSNTWVDMTHFVPETGQTIQLKRARVKGFRMANVSAPVAQAQAPQQQYQQQAPQQFAQPAAQPPAQFAPPAQQQWAPPAQAQQYAPPQAPPQAWAPPAQPQYAQPVQQGYAPPGTQPQMPQMPQAWAPPPGAPQVYQQPQQAQPQYAPPPQIPQPQMAPVGFAPPAPPANVPWAQPPNGAAPETVEQTEAKKRGRPRKAPEGAPQG